MFSYGACATELCLWSAAPSQNVGARMEEGARGGVEGLEEREVPPWLHRNRYGASQEELAEFQFSSCGSVWAEVLLG